MYVTGSVGGARAGLQTLRASAATAHLESCVARYLYPQARVRAGLLLGRNRAATACMDLSDGLADGVRQIAEASKVGMTIERAAVPVDPAARTWFESRHVDPVTEALGGGDDYELLFTASPELRGRLRAVGAARWCRHHSHRHLHEGFDGDLAGASTVRKPATPLPAGFGHFR